MDSPIVEVKKYGKKDFSRVVSTVLKKKSNIHSDFIEWFKDK